MNGKYSPLCPALVAQTIFNKLFDTDLPGSHKEPWHTGPCPALGLQVERLLPLSDTFLQGSPVLAPWGILPLEVC